MRAARSGSRVHAFVDLCRQLPADAMDFREVLHRRLPYTLQAAEGLEQLPASLRTEARDFFEPRLAPCFVARLPVARNRETMCLVTYTLDYAQRRRVRREYKRGVLTGKEYPLLPHPTVGTFGHADH